MHPSTATVDPNSLAAPYAWGSLLENATHVSIHAGFVSGTRDTPDGPLNPPGGAGGGGVTNTISVDYLYSTVVGI